MRSVLSSLCGGVCVRDEVEDTTDVLTWNLLSSPEVCCQLSPHTAIGFLSITIIEQLKQQPTVVNVSDPIKLSPTCRC